MAKRRLGVLTVRESPSPSPQQGRLCPEAMDLRPLLRSWSDGAASYSVCPAGCALSGSFGALVLGISVGTLVGCPSRCIFVSRTLLCPLPAPWACWCPCCSGPGGLDLRFLPDHGSSGAPATAASPPHHSAQPCNLVLLRSSRVQRRPVPPSASGMAPLPAVAALAYDRLPRLRSVLRWLGIARNLARAKCLHLMLPYWRRCHSRYPCRSEERRVGKFGKCRSRWSPYH